MNEDYQIYTQIGGNHTVNVSKANVIESTKWARDNPPHPPPPHMNQRANGLGKVCGGNMAARNDIRMAALI